MIMANGINGHIDDLDLWDYVRGGRDYGERIIIATHLHLCKECELNASVFEDACGELLENSEKVPMSKHSIDIALARTEIKTKNMPLPQLQNEIYGHSLPDNLKGIKTKPRHFLGPNVWIAPIVDNGIPAPNQAYFLWVKAGMQMLPHSHTNNEITLILEGGFKDGENSYHAGDIIYEDGHTIHAPEVLGDEDCLCLVYQDGPILPKTFLGKLLKPFARI